MAREDRTIGQGIVVGMIGYVAVAGLYAAFDMLAARGPFYTVDLLGKSLFNGLRDPSILGLPIVLDTRAIILYSGLHLTFSLAIGTIVMALVALSERRPTTSPLVLLTLVGGFGVTVIVVGLLTGHIRPLLPWWSVVAANALAVVLAGAFILWKRPGTWRRLLPFGG